MEYRKFTLTTHLYDSTPIPEEHSIDNLNELCKKEGWSVITSLYTVNNTTILLLEKRYNYGKLRKNGSCRANEKI